MPMNAHWAELLPGSLIANPDVPHKTSRGELTESTPSTLHFELESREHSPAIMSKFSHDSRSSSYSLVIARRGRDSGSYAHLVLQAKHQRVSKLKDADSAYE